MKWFPFTITVLIGAILKAGLLNLIAIGDDQIRPSILTIMLIYFAMSPRGEFAIAASFIIGFAADLAGNVMGPYTLLFGLIGSILNQGQPILSMKRPFYRAIITFLITLITVPLAGWLGSIKTGQPVGMGAMSFVWTALYTAIVCMFIWPILAFFTEMFGHSPTVSRIRTGGRIHV